MERRRQRQLRARRTQHHRLRTGLRWLARRLGVRPDDFTHCPDGTCSDGTRVWWFQVDVGVGGEEEIHTGYLKRRGNRWEMEGLY